MAKAISSHVLARAFIEALPKEIDGIEELRKIRDRLLEEIKVKQFIRESGVSIEDRKKALEMLSPESSKETVHFILLLAQHKQLSDLDSVLEALERVYADRFNLLHANVQSVIPLTEKEKTRIKKALKQKTKKDIVLHEDIEYQMLGGLKITLNDWTFDASVRGRIERLKRTITV